MESKLNAIGRYVVRWKIESEEERRLAFEADCSTDGKKRYLEFYKNADKNYYNKGVEMAKAVINKHGLVDGLSEEYIIEDMIYSLHRYGFRFDEYFWFNLYNLNNHGREGFISDKMRFEYYLKLNTQEGMNILRDKYLTYQRLKKYYKRDCCAIYIASDEEKYNHFTQQHDICFYKPLASDSAKGCTVIKLIDTSFEELFKNGPFILEELIQQCGDFAEFYPDAVNLIRVPLLITKDGSSHLMGPFITLGQNNMKAVNAGAGGIIASIDPKTGVVLGNGWMENNSIEFSHHPQSGKKILGYQIPDWDEAVQICVEASKLIPECKYIGFDLAQTKNGWVIIEANCYAQFLGQRNTNGLRRDILKHLENI